MTRKEYLDKRDDIWMAAEQEIVQICLERDEQIAKLKAELKEGENGKTGG